MSDLNSITQALDPLLGVNVSTVALTSAGGASTGVAIPQLPDNSAPGNNAFQFDVLNTNTAAIAIAFAVTSAAAVAAAVFPTGTPGAYVLAAGERRTLTVRGKPQFVAINSVAATVGSVYVTPGNGRA